MKEWYRAKELMGLPGMPGSDRVIRLKMQGWRTRDAKAASGGVAALEAHISSLPPETRAYLEAQAAELARQEAQALAQAVVKALPVPVAPVETAPGLQRCQQGLWAWFERQPQTTRDEGTRRAQAVLSLEALVTAGHPRMEATATIARQLAVHAETLRAWVRQVRDVSPGDYAPVLCSHRERCGRVRKDIPDDAWRTFLGDYLRPEQPSIKACYERLERVAASRGWELPTRDTFERRLAELPTEVKVLAREGQEALEKLYPVQKRDRSVFHALEAVNADGHRFDVFVRWEDGTIGRPMVVFWQDLYSGKMLSYRIGQTENRHSVRLALLDVVRQYGKPQHVYFDNGRGFASKWMTGGSHTRFRFRVLDEEIQGLLPALGAQVHFTLPYSGKSKPIERAFQDLCQYVSKHPAMSGAYTGNSVDAKPENYGSKAVDIKVFEQILETEIAAHNARPGRRSDVCKGQSFDAVFQASYSASVIPQATREQLRMLLLASELTTAHKTSGMVSIPGAPGNQYWSEGLAPMRGQRVVVRFDPERLADGVCIYTEQGEFVAEAAPWGAVAFNDMAQAQVHNRNRRAYVKHTRKALEHLNRLEPEAVAAQLPGMEAASVEKPKIVQLDFQAQTRSRAMTRELEDEQVDNLLAMAMGR